MHACSWHRTAKQQQQQQQQQPPATHLDHREKAHDVVVSAHLLQVHDLPERALRVSRVAEGVEALL